MIKWSVKSSKISGGERGNVKDIPQEISARTGSCHTFPQCSLCCEALEFGVSAWSLVEQQFCVWYMPKARPFLKLLCLQKPFAEQTEPFISI